MSFNIGKALGATVDAVTQPFKSDIEQDTGSETAQRSLATHGSVAAFDCCPFSRAEAMAAKSQFLASLAMRAGTSNQSLFDKAGNLIGDLLGDDDSDPAEYNGVCGDPTVAIIDHFQTENGRNHGAAVEEVLLRNGTVEADDIQRIQANVDLPWKGDTLDEVIENYGTTLLDNTRESLGQLDSSVKTVNISQGISQADIIAIIMDKKSPAAVANELGLPTDTAPQEVMQALTDRVQAVFENSDKLAAAKANYNQVTDELADRGVTVVVSADNSGVNAQYLKDRGIETDENTITDNVLANDDVVLVGAADESGIADFSGSYGDVTVTADGTDVATRQGPMDGTSFSAPLVAGAIASMKAVNPNLSHAEVMGILSQASRDTAISNDLEGSGDLDVQEAIRLARGNFEQDPNGEDFWQQLGHLLGLR